MFGDIDGRAAAAPSGVCVSVVSFYVLDLCSEIWLVTYPLLFSFCFVT